MTNNRQKANKALVKAISDFLDSNPEQRFNQVLVNLDVSENKEYSGDCEKGYIPFYVDEIDYHEEPNDTLARVKKAIKRMEINE